MNIGYITNLRAPYRTLQINEFNNLEGINLTVYYTDKPNENRKWNVNGANNFKEIDLDGIKIAGKFGYINKGLIDIVKNNNLIILGCYEQPTYILLSILCRKYKQKYILSFDGISTDRLMGNENIFKKLLKNIVIKNAYYILGNGTVSKRYFNEVFDYPIEKIKNQYLTVDIKKIDYLYKDRDNYRTIYREKLGISEDNKVLIYSGRLIEIKNVESVVKAIKNINDKNIVFLITGGGKLESKIKELGKSLGVKVIITGFISEQEELFRHYFAGDALILPSVYEPWGLVVNEAMAAGLPVIVSDICGCSLDLVKEGKNGFKINPNDIDDISLKIKQLFYEKDIKELGQESKNIINQWTVENARKELNNIIDDIKGGM